MTGTYRTVEAGVAMVEKLAGEARKQALAELPGWSEAEGRDAIQKYFKFVDIVLSTHDCGGLSELDVKLAKRIDRYAGV
jgi:4a-hydroxytetrahydrobiopterin dehydratase